MDHPDYLELILKTYLSVPNLTPCEVADLIIGCKQSYSPDWQLIYYRSMELSRLGYLKEMGIKQNEPVLSITFNGLWRLHRATTQAK
jgi:hypothetical protein